jgi:membrane fusion protein, multidrug efflux system
MNFFWTNDISTRNSVTTLTSRHTCLACFAITMLILSSCSGNKGQPQTVMAFSGVPVTVATAGQKTVPIEVTSIGNVEAFSTVSVRGQIAGEVEKAYFKQGQDVKQGDLLFTLDSRPYKATLQQLQANLARDEAQLENAQAQAERYTKLFKAGIVSQDQYDQFRTGADALAAAVRADKAAIEKATVDLDYCTIRSPIEGRTGALQVYPGNIVKENDTILVTINQIRPIYVTFSVPEQYLSEIRKYQETGALAVGASIPNDSRPPAQGVLTFIDNAVDTTTGTIKLRATFQNPDRRLWPGQFVNVTVKLTSKSNATVVPTQAVQTGQVGKYLFVVKPDQTAELRQVTAGQTVGGVTIIEKGIRPGETVVTDGQLRLEPGTKVQIKNPPSGAPESNS